MVLTFHDSKAPAVPAEVEGDVVLQKQTPTGEAPAVLTDGAWCGCARLASAHPVSVFRLT